MRYFVTAMWSVWGLLLISKNREKIDTFNFMIVWLALLAASVSRW